MGWWSAGSPLIHDARHEMKQAHKGSATTGDSPASVYPVVYPTIGARTLLSLLMTFYILGELTPGYLDIERFDRMTHDGKTVVSTGSRASSKRHSSVDCWTLCTSPRF